MSKQISKIFNLNTLSSGSTSSEKLLWDIYDINVEDNSFKIVHSTINGVIATNINSKLYFNPNGVTYLNAEVTSSNGEISSFYYNPSNIYTAIPVEKNIPPFNFSILIALIDKGDPVKLVASLPMALSAIELFRVSKLTDSSLGLPYDSYYTWRVLQ